MSHSLLGVERLVSMQCEGMRFLWKHTPRCAYGELRTCNDANAQFVVRHKEANERIVRIGSSKHGYNIRMRGFAQRTTRVSQFSPRFQTTPPSGIMDCEL